MAWTDYSSTLANGWDSAIGSTFYDTSINTSGEEFFYRVTISSSSLELINSVDNSYNIPGFDDGYQPEGVNNPIAGDLGGGSGSNTPAVRGSSIDSDATAATSWTGTVPTTAAGDLMIAVLMTRATGGALTAPAGWTQQGPTYLNSIIAISDVQYLAVYTKVAAASEPATFTWTLAGSARVCGFLVSMVGNDFTMGTVAQAYGNAQDASITNTGADFYINAATWVYAENVSTEGSSQTGPGLTQITDSPVTASRISGGYTSQDGLVQSYHDTDDATNSPNHGIISIPFTVTGSGGGGGSARPSSGFLYPRGQG
jgi:hypothetical protein